MTDTEARVPAAHDDDSQSGSVRYGAGKGFAWFLLLAGIAGFLAAFDLTVEKIALLKNPNYELSCDINPLLSCGSIVTTEQAEVFGFPNPLLGIAGFSVVITTAVALLAGAKLRRWYWVGLCLGAGLGTVFVGWLIFQSLYRIGALCPYCMVVWTVTIPIFLFSVRQTLMQSTATAATLRGALIQTYVRNTYWLLALIYILIISIIGIRFWDYWSTVF